MPSCYGQRVDHADFNPSEIQSIGRLVTDGDDTIWIFYACRTSGGVNPQFSRRIFVRKYTISTDTLGSAIQIDDGEAQGQDLPQACRLEDGTGRLICVYKFRVSAFDSGVKVKESIDGGATWSAAVKLDVTHDFNDALLHPYGVSTEPGGRVLVFMQHEGGPGDTYMVSRIGPGSWNTPTLVFNGSGTNQWIFSENSARNHVVIDSNRACFVGGRITSAAGLKNLSGMYSLLGPTDWHEVTPFYTSSVPITAGMKLVRGGDNRLRVQWVDNVNFSPHRLFIAYSDDAGANWTVIGAPTNLIGYNWDPTYPHAVAMDSANQWFISGTFFGDAGLKPYRVFKGADNLNDWSVVLECTLNPPFNGVITAGVGESIFVKTDHFHIASYVETSGPSTLFKLMMIKVAGIGANGTICPTPPCPPPPPVPPSCPGPLPCVIFTPPPVPPSNVYLPRGYIHVTKLRDGHDTCAPMESWGSADVGGP